MFEYLRKIKKEYKIVFTSCFAWALLAHGTIFFNKISFHDDIAGLFNVGSTYTLGRWGLGVLESLFCFLFDSTLYSLPVFNGLLSILCISIATCFLVSIFDYKKTSSLIVISGIMVTIPVITGLFGFMFTAPFYLIGMLSAVTGAYLLINHKNILSIIVAILLICFGCGVYQAYFSFALGILYIYLFSTLIKNLQINFKSFLLQGIYYISACALSLVCYLLINKTFLTLKGLSLSSYAGLDQIGNTSVIEYINRLMNSYTSFFSFRNDIYPMSSSRIFPLLLIITFLLGIFKLFKNYKERYLLLLSGIIMFFVLPLGINNIYLIAGNIHSLMLYTHVLLFYLFIAELEELQINKTTLNTVVFELSITLILFINIIFCYHANACYLKATFMQAQTTAQLNTLITRIKSLDGYNDELPITYIGTLTDSSIINTEQFNQLETIPYIFDTSGYLGTYSWKSFMNMWCGYSPKEVSSTDFELLNEVKNMPKYPADDSIQIINNTIVVKFK